MQVSLINILFKKKFYINNNFFRKEYKISKDKSTGSMINHLRKEHGNLLENSKKSIGEIDRYLTNTLEKVVNYFFI